MATIKVSVDQVVESVKSLKREERQEFLERLVEIGDFKENLEDIAIIFKRRDETLRPYNDFVDELRKEGKL